MSLDAAFGPDWFISLPGGDAPITGWLTLATWAHCETVGELSFAEARILGELLRTISLAIVSLTGAERTYIANKAEASRHVHFHIIPRFPDLDPSRRGAEVFRLISGGVKHPLVSEQIGMLEEIRAHVTRARFRSGETPRP